MIPLPVVEVIRRVGWGTDPLSRAARSALGGQLDHPVLATALRQVSIGTWSLGPKTVSYIQKVVETVRPRLVMEFGSGISTMCLAQFLADQTAAGGAPGSVVSFEQSSDEASRTMDLLGRHGLGSHAEVVVAPLRMREVEGRYVNAYEFDPDVIDALTGTDKVDLVLVDGPAAESGARFGTLPLIRRFVRPGAVFLLDDALRDGELSAAAGWSRLPYLQVEGILPIEHGILRGSFR